MPVYKNLYQKLLSQRNNSDLVSKRLLVVLVLEMKEMQNAVRKDVLRLNAELLEQEEVKNFLQKIEADDLQFELEIEKNLAVARLKKEDFSGYINPSKICNRHLLQTDVRNELMRAHKFLQPKTLPEKSVLS